MSQKWPIYADDLQSYTRTSNDAEQLMKQAYERTGKIPRVIYTDKLRAYLEGIERVFGGDTRHSQGGPFTLEHKANYIERFHSTLKSRTKVMRGLHTMKTARLFLDGWLVHYNFFRPHMSLNDRTPASVAGIRFPFRNWKDITEQPYEMTTRIDLDKPRLMTMPKRVRITKTKRIRITKRQPRITTSAPMLSSLRTKLK
ncbi:MAG: hypothetical protein CL874_05335 [Dehalococcoidales bacterium]|nr:hypothetical protein [Dehalococcoidales bacterium]